MRFLSSAASILKLLTDATRGVGGCQTSLRWDQGMQLALTKSKAVLAQAAELIHPDPTAEISLAVDASDHHMGGVLQQWTGSTWAPLAFLRRKLTEAEAHYSIFDTELLACVAAIKHFRYLLEGQKLFIWCDHKLLTYSLHRVSYPWSVGWSVKFFLIGQNRSSNQRSGMIFEEQIQKNFILKKIPWGSNINIFGLK